MDCLDSCHAFQNETWCFPLQPYHIVCNAVLNRLESAAKAEGSRGATAIRQLRADLAADVQKLPLDDRIGARATSDSQLYIGSLRVVTPKTPLRTFLPFLQDERPAKFYVLQHFYAL